MAQFTVLGDALVDVHVVPAEPIRAGGDVPAEIRLEPGGQGANLAVRLARRGNGVRLATAMADDAGGRMLRGALETDDVAVLPLGAPVASGVVVVLLDAKRERTMLSQRVPLLGPGSDTSALLDADWLIVSGYVLLEPGAAIAAAGDRPRRGIAGCSLAQDEAAGWLEAAAGLAPHLVVLNADEARTLCGADVPNPDLAERLGDRLRAIVVVTDASGADATHDGGTVHVTATADRSAVDTTGAGDAFAAALMSELADGPWPPPRDRLEAALGSATLAAGEVIRTRGAQARVAGEG